MKKIWLTLARHRKVLLGVLIWLVLIGAVTWAGKGIFKYSIFSTHDGDHHIARVIDAIKSIREGEFPLRWAGSLDYLCGVPIFNFYYPLIYYLATLLYFFTNNVIFSLKIIDFASLLLGTIFFYLWIRDETKKELPAISGALTYLYAPYRFSLIFVRGSPEFLAYAILPVVLYLYSLCFNSKDKKFIFYAFLASVAGAILTISHNFTVMFLMPLILIYLIIKIYIHRLNFKKIFWIAFSYLSAFGMGSFFIGPAFLEQKFTKIGQSFLEWRDHFPTLWQLIRSKWGYFYSSSGTVNDGMSFMLGYAQWLILGIAAIFIIYQVVKNKFRFWKIFNENIWIIFFFLASLFTLYLILPISIPLWEKIKLLQQVQFSWRLLGTAIFTTSALFSFILAKVNSKKLYIGLFIGVSLLTVFGTRNFMLPQPISQQDLYRYDNFEKFHPETYSTTTLGDEIIASGATKACWFTTPIISTNKGENINSNIIERGNTFGSVKFLIDKKAVKGDKIILALGYFPNIHKISLNGGNPMAYSDCGGQVCFGMDETRNGENFISWEVGQSPTENFFNYLTLTFFAVWVLVLFTKLTGIYKDKRKLVCFVLTVIIFLLFLFFRSYNLSSRLGFGWDQERDAVAATNILAGKFTLLGPRVQGPAGFFLPPYFFYLLAPFYALTHLSPVATSVFIVFWSLLFFTVTYFVLSKTFGKKTALFFLAYWAVNPLSVSIDTIAWNPVAIPLLFILLIYLNYLYFKDQKTKYIILAGLIFGLGISFHLQFLFIAPVFIPLFVDIFRSRKFKKLIFLAASTVLPFLPIIIFDLRHNFLNFRQIIGFVKSGDMGINRVLFVWEKVSSFMIGGSPSKFLGLIIYVLVLVGLFVLGRKLKDEAQRRILSGLGFVWGLSLPLFYFFVRNPSEYYFNYLLVPFVILISLVLKNLKRFGILILVAVSVYFIFREAPLLSDSTLNLKEKNQVVVFLSNITKSSTPFNISFDVPFNEDAGFRYLLKYNNVGYSGNPKDPLIEFVIPYQKRLITFKVRQIGIYIPSEWLKDNWPAKSK